MVYQKYLGTPINVGCVTHSLYTVGTDALLEKKGDLTKSYDKTPIQTENSKTNGQNQNATKNSIKQRLRTDLGRSVRVTTVNQCIH